MKAATRTSTKRRGHPPVRLPSPLTCPQEFDTYGFLKSVPAAPVVLVSRPMGYYIAPEGAIRLTGR